MVKAKSWLEYLEILILLCDHTYLAEQNMIFDSIALPCFEKFSHLIQKCLNIN